MKVGDYIQAKFEIADLLRTAAPKARARNPEDHYPFENIFKRLAEDRFNIAVVGQFSRGKTSLMNAMLDTDRLPTGIIPLTSVITTVQYGPRERAVLEYYEEHRLPYEVALADIAEYVSQRSNPGNEKRIKYAHVDLPSELLRQGFFLVDTPGLGSAIAENTRTTEEFLPEADAFILVTSYDSPLSSEEYRLLCLLKEHAYRTFLIVNKLDLASAADRQDADAHIRRQIHEVFGDNGPEIFSLSAREAMEAERTGDTSRYDASGVPAFMNRLTNFLIEEKQTEFLRRLIERVDSQLNEVGTCSDEIARLSALRQSLFGAAAARPTAQNPFSESLRHAPGQFALCMICRRMEQAAWDFLRQFQYRITIDRHVRDIMSDAGGLCAFHTWQYAAIASTHGTCVAFPAVLDRLAGRLATLLGGIDNPPGKIADWCPTADNCFLCLVCRGAETSGLKEAADIVARANSEKDFPSLCFPHLAKLSETTPDLSRSFLKAQVKVWERMAEDMRRYALKRDALRRAFTTSDEIDSDLRGLRLLAGHRTLSYTPPLDR